MVVKHMQRAGECFEGAGQQIPIFLIEWKHTAGVCVREWPRAHTGCVHHCLPVSLR